MKKEEFDKLAESLNKIETQSNEIPPNELHREEFITQREQFAKDESYFKKYKDVKIDGRNVLVRLFVFESTSGIKGNILVPSKDLRGNIKWTPADKVFDSKIMPIGKVIAIGSEVENKDIKVGSLVTLPYSEVEGLKQNPDYLHYLQFAGAEGMNPNFIPAEIPQYLPRIEVDWERYMFKHIDNFQVDADDKLTYLLPEIKIVGIWG